VVFEIIPNIKKEKLSNVHFINYDMSLTRKNTCTANKRIDDFYSTYT
jgi:hypothetical protein